MKHKISRLTSYLFRGGLSKKEYASIREEIQERNRSSLEMTSLFLVLMFGGLFLGSLFSEMMVLNRSLYCITGSCFLIILIGCILLKKKRSNALVMLLWYLAMTAMFTYAIYLNNFIRHDISATTFCLILLAAPLLLMDQPWRLMVYYVLVVTVFVFVEFRQKSYTLAFTDTVNALCCVFFGSMIHIQIVSVKLREMLMRKHIEKERDTDRLTGCFTKEAFVRKVEEYFSNQGHRGVLILMDLDHFKEINDTYGHMFGDMVLRTMGECIRQSFPETGLSGRFGGDEFMVWLPGDWDRAGLEGKLQLFLDKLHAVATPDEKVKIESSIGVAMCPGNGDTYEKLLGNADMALYSAKKLGKNRYVFCPEERENRS